MNWSLQLASDHVYITITLFFICVLLVQNWASSGFKVRWLITAVLVFFLGLLTYENIAFLFPVAFILAFPLAKFSSEKEFKSKITLAGIVSLLSIFLILIPLKIYESLAKTSELGFAHPAFNDPNVLNEIPQRVASIASLLAGYFYNFSSGLAISSGKYLLVVQILSVALFLFLVTYPLFLVNRIKPSSKAPTEKGSLISLYLSALGLIVLGLLPYALWGGSADLPHVRFYSLPIFGISILLLLGVVLSKRQAFRYVFVAICMLSVLLGLFEFNAYSKEILAREFLPIHDYASMIEIMPRVREGTSFIFLDGDMGYGPWNGCSLALRMLYATRDLKCIFLSSTIPDYSAVRNSDGILANQGGLLNDENWIIIGLNDQGQRYIIPEINSQSDLIINWESAAPIKTDYRRIITDQGPVTTQMYLHLLMRLRAKNTIN
jgi:hypothetical protein